jgi:hypothetical protein
MNKHTKLIESLEEWTAILVRWDDAHSPTAGWHDIADYEPDRDTTAITLGWYWKNAKAEYLTLAGTVFPHPETGKIKTVGDITHIPIGWIKDITKLEDTHAHIQGPPARQSRRNRV